MNQTSFERALALLESLDEVGDGYILEGGLAMSFHDLCGQPKCRHVLDPTEKVFRD